MQFLKQLIWKEENKFNRFFFWILIFLILFGIFLRFFLITEMGVYGNDTCVYINIAKAWSEGNFIYQIGGGNPIIRPVIFFIFAGAIKIFGYQDYSIKLANAIIDSFIILLMMFISYRLSNRNLWVSLSAGSIYALLPIAITFSRTELTHTISTFMVLISFFFFILYFQADRKIKKYLFITFTGIFTGLATLSHDELVFIAPAFVFFIFIHFISHTRSIKNFKYILIESSLYMVTTFLICQSVIYLHLFSFTSKLKNPLQDPSIDLNVIQRFFVFIWNGISTNTSTIFLLLFLFLGFSIGIFKLLKWLKCKKVNLKFPFLFYLPWVIVFEYIFLYAFFSNMLLSRLYLPLVPLMIIALVIGYEKIFKSLKIRFSNSIMIIIGLSIILFNIGHYSEFRNFLQKKYSVIWTYPAKFLDLNLPGGYEIFLQQNYRKKWYRQIYEQLHNQVNENARLLITSTIHFPYPARRMLQLGFYFGDNAIYVIDHTEPLKDIISKYKIKYLLYTLFRADRRLLSRKKPLLSYQYNGKWSIPESNQVGMSYGFPPGEFTVEKEYLFLEKFLKKKNATPIFEKGNIKKSMEKLTKSKKKLWINGSTIIHKF